MKVEMSDLRFMENFAQSLRYRLPNASEVLFTFLYAVPNCEIHFHKDFEATSIVRIVIEPRVGLYVKELCNDRELFRKDFDFSTIISEDWEKLALDILNAYETR